ncbi:MAG: magnesium transporter CorA family protein [Armatimonadetes bacterium]|nr:magnesium transporter CorA family protein [Armatimonadota bacterium]
MSLSRPGQVGCEHIDPACISDVLGEPGVVLWVDVQDPGPAEVAMLQEEFGFHSLALEDVAAQRQRPKVDEYPDYYYVVMYAPLPLQERSQLEIEELDAFAGRNYVVTCHRGELDSLRESVLRWERTEPELRAQVGFLLHVITDTVIDSYFPVVEALEDQLDEIELAMFRPRAPFDAEQLLNIKRSLYTLRKAIYPLREVFNTFLRRDQLIFSADTVPYFQDAYDHVLRLLDTLDIERDMATGAIEVQLSVVSNRLNETMKRLTVVAICVAILGAVFGAWGMNFTTVPLAHLGLTGFYLVVAGTLALVGAVLAVARRLGYW